MPSFEKTIERLLKLEIMRLEPSEPECMAESLSLFDESQPIKSIESAFDMFVDNSAFIEEEIYSKTYQNMPGTYGNYYVQSPEVMDLVRSLPFNLRQALPGLGKQKKINQAILFNKIKSELIIVNKDEMDFYLARGYNLIDEQVAYASEETISGADGLNTDGTGKVRGFDKPLFMRNRKELSKYLGKVFEIPPALFDRMKKGRRKFESWGGYIEEEGDETFVSDIKTYSLRNNGRPVIIQNSDTGERAMLRRKQGDNRLKYNRKRNANA